MIKITAIKKVNATLVCSKEYNIPHVGLVSNAFYTTDEIPFNDYTKQRYLITWWNAHAPVKVQADIVTAKNAEDAPFIVLDSNGKPERDKDGKIVVTRQIVVMCPKTKEGTYYMGHSPEVTVQNYINNRLMPTVWGQIKGLVEFG